MSKYDEESAVGDRMERVFQQTVGSDPPAFAGVSSYRGLILRPGGREVYPILQSAATELGLSRLRPRGFGTLMLIRWVGHRSIPLPVSLAACVFVPIFRPLPAHEISVSISADWNREKESAAALARRLRGQFDAELTPRLAGANVADSPHYAHSHEGAYAENRDILWLCWHLLGWSYEQITVEWAVRNPSDGDVAVGVDSARKAVARMAQRVGVN